VPPLRLGLFGGTFDPPHFGHLVVAQEVAEQLSLDRLLFLVAGLPPHKVGEKLSPPAIRLEMTRAAVEGNPLFDVSEVELMREGPTFTVDTLRQFRTAHPDAELFFLLGADQLVEFHEWQEPEAIAGLATLVAVRRNGVDPKQIPPVDLGSGKRLEFISPDVTRIDLSSSEVRARVREGRSIRYLVPESVRRIIRTHRLYRSIS
jgi:nicotinate-nucleotide adenylyltransferase